MLLGSYLSGSLHPFEFPLIDDHGLALQTFNRLLADVSQLILSQSGYTCGIIVLFCVTFKSLFT